MELGDVGMFQRGLHLDLIQEAVGQTPISFEIRQQHFHGFDAVRKNIADLINLAHAAHAQDPNDFIVADTIADIHPALLQNTMSSS